MYIQILTEYYYCMVNWDKIDQWVEINLDLMGATTLAGPFRRFSMHMWQNAYANTVRYVMVSDVYFPFSKIL